MPRSLFVLIALLFSSTVSAEEPQVGRLPDGRAYRIDSSGVQLVDYIAELELNIETLNRRVNGLEAEVEEKQRALDNVKNTGRPEGILIEKNLTGSRSAVVPVRSQEVSCPVCPDPVTCPTLRCPEVRCPDKTCPSLECPKLSCDRENTIISRLTEDRDKLALELHESRESNVETREGAERNEASYGRELASLKKNLLSQEQEIELLRAKLTGAEERERSAAERAREEAIREVRLKEEEKESTELVVASVNTEQSRAALAPPPSEIQRPSLPSRVANPEALDGARNRALDSLRGKLNTDLNQLQSLVVTRDRLFQENGSRISGLSVKASPARSSRNATVASLRTEVSKATSVGQLAQVSRDISEIRSTVSGDINLVKRISKG